MDETIAGTQASKRARRTPDQIAKDLRDREDKLIEAGMAAAQEEEEIKKQIADLEDKLKKARAAKQAGRKPAERRAYVNGYDRLIKKFKKENDFKNAFSKTDFDNIENEIFTRISELIKAENKLREIMPGYFQNGVDNVEVDPAGL